MFHERLTPFDLFGSDTLLRGALATLCWLCGGSHYVVKERGRAQDEKLHADQPEERSVSSGPARSKPLSGTTEFGERSWFGIDPLYARDKYPLYFILQR